MSEKRLRRRTPVRYKHVRDDIIMLTESVGLELDLAESFLERGHFEGRDLILVDRVPLGMHLASGEGMVWFPTLRGIVAWQPERSWAAVDHGGERRVRPLVPGARAAAVCSSDGNDCHPAQSTTLWPYAFWFVATKASTAAVKLSAPQSATGRRAPVPGATPPPPVFFERLGKEQAKFFCLFFLFCYIKKITKKSPT